MRKRTLFISLFLLLAAWAAAFLTVFFQECELPQDAVAVNEVLQTVQDGWEDLAGGRAGGEAFSFPCLSFGGSPGLAGGFFCFLKKSYNSPSLFLNPPDVYYLYQHR